MEQRHYDQYDKIYEENKEVIETACALFNLFELLSVVANIGDIWLHNSGGITGALLYDSDAASAISKLRDVHKDIRRDAFDFRAEEHRNEEIMLKILQDAIIALKAQKIDWKIE